MRPFITNQIGLPENTDHLHNICTTSAQRLRRWSNIAQMSYKCFVWRCHPVDDSTSNSAKLQYGGCCYKASDLQVLLWDAVPLRSCFCFSTAWDQSTRNNNYHSPLGPLFSYTVNTGLRLFAEFLILSLPTVIPSWYNSLTILDISVQRPWYNAIVQV